MYDKNYVRGDNQGTGGLLVLRGWPDFAADSRLAGRGCPSESHHQDGARADSLLGYHGRNTHVSEQRRYRKLDPRFGAELAAVPPVVACRDVPLSECVP